MNTQEYISSGILEDYVLGTLGEQERKEVECMSHIYPEIKAELDVLAVSFENFVVENYAKKVPYAVTNNIFNAIDAIEKNKAQEAKEIKLNTNIPTQSQSNNFKWLAAASLILAIAMGAMYLNSTSKLEKANAAIASLTNEQDSATQKLLALQKEFNNSKEMLALVNDPDYKKVTLKGTQAMAPKSSMLVCYCPTMDKLFISANSLPAPTADKQYQLWAIVNGKPVDLGVFDYKAGDIIAMKAVENAQSFAVTLENKGGSPVPTMEQMFVIGNV